MLILSRTVIPSTWLCCSLKRGRQPQLHYNRRAVKIGQAANMGCVEVEECRGKNGVALPRDICTTVDCKGAQYASQYNNGLDQLVVVLDLDECLLHSKFYGSQEYRQMENRPENIREVDSFWLELDDGVAQVNKRPGLDAFLSALASTCTVIAFTAAMPDYAKPVLDKIDPKGILFSRRLYRSSCREVRGAFLKDLNALGAEFKNPGRVVLLDNNPCSFLCQANNGILVTSFYDDAEDTALDSVLRLIQYLERIPDVRPVLNEMFRLEALLSDYRAVLIRGIEDQFDFSDLPACKHSEMVDSRTRITL